MRSDKLTAFALTAFVLLFAAACKKKSDEIRIDERVRSYFDYQPGTYWIMKDSATGDIDSFVVTTRNEKIISTDFENVETIDVRIIEYPSANGSDSSGWTISMSNGTRALMGYENFLRKKRIGFNNIQQSENDTTVFPLEQNGQVYTDVNFTEVSMSFANDYDAGLPQNFRWWYNKMNGIIRLDIALPWQARIWQLVRGRVIRPVQ
jgi:hypothetical protein